MSWVYVFLGFCALILLHEAGHFVAAKATGMRVEGFYLFFGPTLWSFKRGETEYGIKAIPLGGYVKINGMNPEEEMPPGHEHRAYHRQKVWKRIVVAAAGPAVNIVLAFVILFAVFEIGGLQDGKPVVNETSKGSAAAKVLEKGDKIVAIDGHAYANLSGQDRIEKFSELVRSHECAGKPTDGCKATTPAEVTVRRDGKLKTFEIFPHYDGAAKRMLLGVAWAPADHWTAATAGESADRSVGLMGEVIGRTGSVFSHIFEEEKRNEISSVVGISDVGHEAVSNGWRQSFLLLALVSLSLGLINLFPILPLDGGHIFWAIVEKLRGGKPVSIQVMERATIIGFALVLMLMVIGVSNDIGRLTGEGFNVSK
ncbi:MAG TPA: site-2 protease family protein [Solirubrobacterales bacterium]|jgi:regulator of sigma E protease|nr:site-2 protease family protein [Solirubrobacterales bacterium]